MSARGSRKSEERAAEVRRIIAILHKWGIHSLGEFAALDKEQVSLRLGSEAVQMWERANGKSMRLLKLVQPPESFAESFEFENEIETIEPLLFILRRFLQQLSLRLGALYFVARELKLRLTFSDKNSYEHVFKIPEPSNNGEVLFRMLHTHLENFTSAAPITAVALEAEPAKPGQQQFSLFESALRDPAQLSETLARLIGLLGAERVGTPVLQDTHRPDAFRIEPFVWELPNEQSEKHTGASAGSADNPSMFDAPAHAQGRAHVAAAFALRRFRTMTSASVLLEKKKPIHLRSAELQGEVTEQDGPYLSSGNWWDEKSWARAEWDLELENGALCRCHADHEGNAWQLDGLYD